MYIKILKKEKALMISYDITIFLERKFTTT